MNQSKENKRITPLDKNLLLKKMSKTNKTASGIILTTKTEKEENQGMVVAVGRNVCSLQKDDIVIFESYKTTTFTYDDCEFMLVNEKDVLAKVGSSCHETKSCGDKKSGCCDDKKSCGCSDDKNKSGCCDDKKSCGCSDNKKAGDKCCQDDKNGKCH